LLFPVEEGFLMHFHYYCCLHRRDNIKRIFPSVKKNRQKNSQEAGSGLDQKKEGGRKAKYITAKRMMPIQTPLTVLSILRRCWSHGEVSMWRRRTLKMPPRGRMVLARQFAVTAPVLIVPIVSA
jgi:hypothetical protein